MLRVIVAALVAASSFLSVSAADPNGPLYELRIYTCERGQLPAMEERFRDHTMRMFERHGIKSIAYWTPTETDHTLIYLLEHASREAAQASWKAFLADPEWKLIAAASEEKHGKLLAMPPESIYLLKTDYSPEIGLPKAGKSYELRTYTTATGKFDDLQARFRDHTDDLFQKHGLRAFGYWVPADVPKSSDTLIYILEADSRESSAASKKAFSEDPAWQKVYQESEAEGKLLAVPPVSVYMELTDFSPIAKE